MQYLPKLFPVYSHISTPYAYIVDDFGEKLTFSRDELSFGRDKAVPEFHFVKDGGYFSCTIDIYYGDILVGSPDVVRIMKGDANSDGVVNAVDASLALTYYAKTSTSLEFSLTSGEEPVKAMWMERLAYMAADIDTESPDCGKNNSGVINGVDASRILTYYAKQSAGIDISWEDITK